MSACARKPLHIGYPLDAVATVLWATGVRILCQPMAMRRMIH